MEDSFMPIVETRIRGLGTEIVNCFTTRIDDFKPMVKKAVDSCLSSDSIRLQIEKLVEEEVKKAIHNAIGGHEVRKAIENVVANSITEKLTN